MVDVTIRLIISLLKKQVKADNGVAATPVTLGSNSNQQQNKFVHLQVK